MAFFQVQFQSQCLQGAGEFAVILPPEQEKRERLPVLYLLHGAFGECLGSLLESSVSRYCGRRGLAIVAPSAYLGVYTDMEHGERAYSFVKEAMAVAERMFPVLSQRPEERFLLGISMGGHGAFKLAMEYPQRFHAAAACSSPIDVVETMRLLEAGRHPGGHELYDAYGGSQAYSGGVGDVMAMAAQRVREGCPLPKLWLCWGDQDHARFEDQVTVEKFRALGIPLETRVGHGGHDFYTWDPMLEDILDWMLEEGQANGLD